jgi:GT2 family glycosyltransferase
MLKYIITTMTDKIGVGIITCNRPEYLRKLMNSLVPCEKDIDELVVVNDGSPITQFDLSQGTWIDNKENLGVAKSKNIAMQHLLDHACTHIFIIEDDVEILDRAVFQKYIEASKLTGILHFNFGPGTPFNRIQSINGDVHNRHLLDQNSKPNPRIIVDYNNIQIALYTHIAGTFSYFHKAVLNKVGLIDEQFYNAWDHVEHTYRIIQKGYHPPFWWFADLSNSDQLLTIQSAALDNSAIAKSKEWYDNLRQGMEKYKRKHGWIPNQTPHTDQRDVLEFLRNLKSLSIWKN